MKYMVIFAIMKRNYCYIYILMLFLSVFSYISVHAQGKWKVDWEGNAYLNGGSGPYLPFWQRTGHDGIIPYSSAAVLTVGGDFRYDASSGIYLETGANLVGQAVTSSPWNSKGVRGIVDRLYVSAGWKMLHLDVGMKPRERELSGLSVSGGNFMYSRNARNIPGINAWSDWIYFEKGHWFGLKGNFAHYKMMDDRYVEGAMIHNKEVSAKVALGKKVDLIAGFGHWVQWGGVSPSFGEYPASFDDYIRVIFGGRGGEDASVSDQVNLLGNHLGREYLRVNWRAEAFTMTFQYDKPFEDSSGMKFKNVPDGIWSLNFSFNDRDSFVTDVLYEFITTTWQSGPYHDRPATEEEMAGQDPDSHYYGKIVLGGCDNYFGNGEYKSGWTNHGLIIGCPLILPAAPGEDGVCSTMASTRVRAHHLGIRGVAFDKIPYGFRATFSKNYGKYHQEKSSPFAASPWQLSMALDLELGERLMDLPCSFAVGVYGDVGELYQDSVGLTLRVCYRGTRTL